MGKLYKLDKLCVPKGERLQLIRKAHTSKVAGHFGVGKTIANLQRYIYVFAQNAIKCSTVY